jgi:hypothetical protein
MGQCVKNGEEVKLDNRKKMEKLGRAEEVKVHLGKLSPVFEHRCAASLFSPL